jgi:hypothetical protein
MKTPTHSWVITHAYLLYEMQGLEAQQIEGLKQFPPRQRPAAFNLDEVLRQITDVGGSGWH